MHCAKGLASIAAYCAVSVASGATFTFGGNVTSIKALSGSSIELPSEIQVGMQLTGVLEFEPFLFGSGNSGEAQRLLVDLEAAEFLAFGVPMRTGDNASDSGSEGISVDSIGVGCISINPCADSRSTSIEGYQLAHLGIRYSGDVPVPVIGGDPVDDLLSRGDDLADPEIWNRLADRRRLLIQLNVPGETGRIDIEAAIGPMAVVPEPGPQDYWSSVR